MADRFQIILSKRAITDLERVFNQIAIDSPNNTAVFIDLILKSIETLREFPHRNIVEGQEKHLNYPVRSLPIQSYLIFFRVIDDKKVVRILRFRHGARKQLKRFE